MRNHPEQLHELQQWLIKLGVELDWPDSPEPHTAMSYYSQMGEDVRWHFGELVRMQ